MTNKVPIGVVLKNAKPQGDEVPEDYLTHTEMLGVEVSEVFGGVNSRT